MTTDFTNDDRAARCERALAVYNDEYDTASNLIDLLADARHWCDRSGRCFGDLDRNAHSHYLAEIDSERSAS
ncbi:MAG: hypothetical protein H6812_10630 [Phycisphaeraceae bacterium]|nr:hypothetical protein [Phycisphaerales bacterium]MCB9843701.1 hypothetical protein [Phycisphaeraceae bacterium]